MQLFSICQNFLETAVFVPQYQDYALQRNPVVVGQHGEQSVHLVVDRHVVLGPLGESTYPLWGYWEQHGKDQTVDQQDYQHWGGDGDTT